MLGLEEEGDLGGMHANLCTDCSWEAHCAAAPGAGIVDAWMWAGDCVQVNVTVKVRGGFTMFS